MKALYISKPGAVEIREIEQPVPGSGEVLLQVKFVGLCKTDLTTYRGNNPMVEMPRIPGHEIAAVIASVGPDVPAKFSPGLKVTLLPYANCGKCPSCQRNRPNACQFNQTMGVQREGALTEYIVAPWQKLFPSKRLSLPELALVEPMAVGLHAVERGQITLDDTVLVLGCGAIGLGIIAAAVWRGARVIAVDINDAKLKMARRLGAAHTINNRTQELHATLQQLTIGGPDVIVEAIGLPETFRAAVEEVAFAGRVVYIGYTKETVSYPAALFVQKELDIRGTRNATIDDFKRVIKMLEAGNFSVKEMITRVVPLAEVGDALRDWEANRAKVIRILVSI